MRGETRRNPGWTQARAAAAVGVCLTVAAGCLALAAASGCAPSFYHSQADSAAKDIIESQQAQAIGRKEPFSIETPSETLRKRLMLDQDLPYSARASLGPDEVERPKNWPEKNGPRRAAATASQPASAPAGPIRLGLLEALRVAAANNRDYQTSKENVYQAALNLDLKAQQFRTTFAGSLDSAVNSDLSGGKPNTQWANSGEFGLRKQFESGAVITGNLALDLVKLLSGDRSSSRGIFLDGTVTVPLLRGSGRDVVTEPMTLAQRQVVYSIATLERFKQTLAVQVASQYLSVLQQQDQVFNAEENYRNLILSTRRARRLADAGRMSEIEVDQARQSELSARDRWVAVQQSYARALDSFKSTLGLPTDSRLQLDRGELERLGEEAKTSLGGAATAEGGVDEASTRAASAPAAAPTAGVNTDANAPVVLVLPSREGGGRLELDPNDAVRIALAYRLDLRNTNGAVNDAQRAVVVAADALRAGLTLKAGGQAGGLASAGSADVSPRADRGVYSADALLELPLEKTAERNAYRTSLIALEQAIRGVQGLEDTVKFQVRDDLRALLQARESFRIQAQAVDLARKRVKSTQLFLEAGRAQMRDLLEAQQSLLDAQNGLSSALVTYRVTELGLQRDMGVLVVDEKGIWHEYETTSRR